MVGQIASIKNAKAIGIAGGKEKCQWTIKNASMQNCIDRKRENIDQKISELCPRGVDIFFDNTGGEIQNIVLSKHLHSIQKSFLWYDQSIYRINHHRVQIWAISANKEQQSMDSLFMILST